MFDALLKSGLCRYCFLLNNEKNLLLFTLDQWQRPYRLQHLLEDSAKRSHVGPVVLIVQTYIQTGILPILYTNYIVRFDKILIAFVYFKFY